MKCLFQGPLSGLLGVHAGQVFHESDCERDVAVNSLGHVTAKLDVPLFQIVNSEPVRRNVKGGVD